jgi:type III secretion protein N (ATPase)
MGEYQQGTDPLTDEAIAQHGPLEEFLNQRTDDFADGEETHEFVSGFAPQ